MRVIGSTTSGRATESSNGILEFSIKASGKMI